MQPDADGAPVPVMTAAQLAERLAAPGGLRPDEADGPPLVVLEDLDGVPELTSLLDGQPLVVAALGDGSSAEMADVVAATEGELAAIAATVTANPSASVALALLLRGAAGRTVPEGLVAESSTYSMLQGGPEHRGWLAARGATPGSPADDEVVKVERVGGELHLTLNRPDVRNAYSAAVRDALLEGLAVAESDPDLRVVLRGAGPSFSSGGDLREFGTATDPAEAHRLRLARSPARVLHRLADRVTVHLHGGCVGAGVELPAFAGRVVAAPGTRMRLPEVAMGLVPGAGGTVSISRRAGRQRTAWMALTGAWVDETTALGWGLVDEVAAVAG